jgi:hypothetical protein
MIASVTILAAQLYEAQGYGFTENAMSRVEDSCIGLPLHRSALSLSGGHY